FFFQAEDGIRDLTVTGVQTCALPIFEEARTGLDLRASYKFLPNLRIVLSDLAEIPGHPTRLHSGLQLCEIGRHWLHAVTSEQVFSHDTRWFRGRPRPISSRIYRPLRFSSCGAGKDTSKCTMCW